ncbi:MAG TPA: immunoglobulin domain-containing protein [Phycisphaerae bacterium]|nr:immunoglobulin domain-containing protein [Phycisphaerae bacterium]
MPQRTFALIPMSLAVILIAAQRADAQPCEPVWDVTIGMPGFGATVDALAVYSYGASTMLHAGGAFTTAGGKSANYIARWDSAAWSALGSGLNNRACALTVFNDGGGDALFVGGWFTSAGGQVASRVARWRNGLWSPVAGGVNHRVAALAVFDDGGGPDLYVGGYFTTAGGGAVSANHIARWNGSAWSALGDGLNDNVYALAVFDDGTGEALYAGGAFTTAGSTPAAHVARWNGSVWSALGDGVDGDVVALTVYNDGVGDALYVGGAFATAGGAPASYIARWDGAAWSMLGDGLDGQVNALGVFGDALYAGGAFTNAGGASANHIATWDGLMWSPLGDGANDSVNALAVFGDGENSALHAAGDFTTAGGVSANRIAKWQSLSGVVITADPNSQTVCEAVRVTFSVAAEGTPPLAFQWTKDGGDIGGATGYSYTLSAAALGDAGSYTCRVSNACSQAESAAAVLTVDAAASIVTHPVGQSVCQGDQALLSVEADGLEPLSYQWRHDGQDLSGATEATYVIEAVDPNDAGDYTCVVTNDCGTVESDPVGLTIGSGPTVTDQPSDRYVCEGAPAAFTVVAGGSEPIAYQWLKDDVELLDANSPSYWVDPVAPADAGSYSCRVSNACGQVTSDEAELTVGTGVVITGDPNSQSVCEGYSVVFRVTADGSAPLSYQWRKDGQDISGATASMYMIPLASPSDEGDYTCAVSNVCGDVQSEPATLTVRAAPSISDQPFGQVVCEGWPAMFSVAAEGEPPLSYQWRKDGVDISGATLDTLVIDAAEEGDGGDYDVVVTNVCGVEASLPATLAVNLAPSIQGQPVDRVVCQGEPTVFSVTVAGSSPMTYQWRKDDVDIPGATTSIFSIDPATELDSGEYTCWVANACGDVTTVPAALTVTNPDFDDDGDVDADDMAVLVGSMNGPNIAPGQPETDLDADGDCDLADYDLLAGRFTGSP